MSDFHSSLDRALAVHVVACAACGSEHVAGSLNDEGLWYGYCLTCGCYFWDRSVRLAESRGFKNP